MAPPAPSHPSRRWLRNHVALRGQTALCFKPHGRALPPHRVTALVGPEGPFIRRLRELGCVLLGKAKTVEFASGGLGLNPVTGTPWNPADLAAQRLPGGSSSGPAVAVAAGMAGFAVGTDTGELCTRRLFPSGAFRGDSTAQNCS